MWNERYGSDEFVYGTEPNSFLAENAKRLTGPVLSLAEGEGRNAVFLASLGLDVLGVDGSAVGLAKAKRLPLRKALKSRPKLPTLQRISHLRISTVQSFRFLHICQVMFDGDSIHRSSRA